MRSLLLLLFFVLGGVAWTADAGCWKRVPESEATQAWRTTSKGQFLRVDGDLSGDGRTDFAQIEISCNGVRVVAFALIKQNNNEKFRRYFLADIPAGQMQAYGVRLAHPGTYQGACAKDYFDCSPGQESAHVTFESVELFKYEGASSIFFWDKATQKFKRLWTED